MEVGMEEELAPEVTVLGQGGESEQAAGAPIRPRVPSVPTIEVTPAMEEERTRKRTPTMLDMEAAAGEDTLPFPPSPPAAADDFPPPNLPSPPAPLVSAPQLGLQPLVPAPTRQPRPGKKGRGLVWVDEDTQISADCIRHGLNNYEDTMRCQEVSKDLARQLPEGCWERLLVKITRKRLEYLELIGHPVLGIGGRRYRRKELWQKTWREKELWEREVLMYRDKAADWGTGFV